MPAKECGVEEGKSEWQPMPQEVTLWIFPCLGWDGIKRVGGSLRDFLLERAGVSLSFR